MKVKYAVQVTNEYNIMKINKGSFLLILNKIKLFFSTK
jgi:hypothetical protein